MLDKLRIKSDYKIILPKGKVYIGGEQYTGLNKGSTRFFARKVVYQNKSEESKITVSLQCRMNGKDYLELNPSRIGTYESLKEALKVFGIDTGEVVEIHYALDFECLSVDEFQKYLMIDYKNQVVPFYSTNPGKTVQGIYFGTGNSKICVYDKSEERLLKRRQKGLF